MNVDPTSRTPERKVNENESQKLLDKCFTERADDIKNLNKKRIENMIVYASGIILCINALYESVNFSLTFSGLLSYLGKSYLTNQIYVLVLGILVSMGYFIFFVWMTIINITVNCDNYKLNFYNKVYWCFVLCISLFSVLALVTSSQLVSFSSGFEHDMYTFFIENRIEGKRWKIDEMQQKLECCGVRNSADWTIGDNDPRFHLNRTGMRKIPLSCCSTMKNFNGRCNEDGIRHIPGCNQQLSSKLRKHLFLRVMIGFYTILLLSILSIVRHVELNIHYKNIERSNKQEKELTKKKTLDTFQLTQDHQSLIIKERATKDELIEDIAIAEKKLDELEVEMENQSAMSEETEEKFSSKTKKKSVSIQKLSKKNKITNKTKQNLRCALESQYANKLKEISNLKGELERNIVGRQRTVHEQVNKTAKQIISSPIVSSQFTNSLNKSVIHSTIITHEVVNETTKQIICSPNVSSQFTNTLNKPVTHSSITTHEVVNETTKQIICSPNESSQFTNSLNKPVNNLKITTHELVNETTKQIINSPNVSSQFKNSLNKPVTHLTITTHELENETTKQIISSPIVSSELTNSLNKPITHSTITTHEVVNEIKKSNNSPIIISEATNIFNKSVTASSGIPHEPKNGKTKLTISPPIIISETTNIFNESVTHSPITRHEVVNGKKKLNISPAIIISEKTNILNKSITHSSIKTHELVKEITKLNISPLKIISETTNILNKLETDSPRNISITVKIVSNINDLQKTDRGLTDKIEKPRSKEVDSRRVEQHSSNKGGKEGGEVNKQEIKGKQEKEIDEEEGEKEVPSPDNYDIECPTCTDTYLHPYMLPCKHVFCLMCARNIFKSKTRECDICRKALPVDFQMEPHLLNLAKKLKSLAKKGKYVWFRRSPKAWYIFDDPIILEIENAFQNKQDTIQLEIESEQYIIDLRGEIFYYYPVKDPKRKMRIKRDFIQLLGKSDYSSYIKDENSPAPLVKIVVTKNTQPTNIPAPIIQDDPTIEQKKVNCVACNEDSVFPVQLPCSHIVCFVEIKKRISAGDKLCSICKSYVFIFNPENNLVKDLPQINLLEKEGKYNWFYENTNTKQLIGIGWWLYEESMALQLEKAYQENQSSVRIGICRERFNIDLKEMKQQSYLSMKLKRNIKRDLIAPQNVKGIAGIKFEALSKIGRLANNPYENKVSDAILNIFKNNPVAKFFK